MIKNFAHRGFKGSYPENTMLAFKKAVEAGADGIEFDTQLSKDGEVVIIHDETLNRVTGVDGYVKDFTLDELRKLNASKNEEDEFGFNAIPTLREYLEYIKDKDIITNIELKNSIFEYPGLEKKVIDLVHEFDLIDKVMLSSFNHESMLKAKELDKNIKCGLLTASCIINPGKYVKELGIEAYHPTAYSLSVEKVKELHKYGIEVNAWTGEIPFSLERLKEYGVDGIISDYTTEVNKVLNR